MYIFNFWCCHPCFCIKQNVCMEWERSWTKCLKNQPCDFIKLRDCPSLLLSSLSFLWRHMADFLDSLSSYMGTIHPHLILRQTRMTKSIKAKLWNRQMNLNIYRVSELNNQNINIWTLKQKFKQIEASKSGWLRLWRQKINQWEASIHCNWPMVKFIVASHWLIFFDVIIWVSHFY